MRRFFLGLCSVIIIIAWLGLFVFWLIAMRHWLGGWGMILAFVLSPGVVIFPLVYWGVEGVFPWVYFALWGVAWLAMILGSVGQHGNDGHVKSAWLRIRGKQGGAG